MKNISTDNKLILSISSLIFIFKWLIILFYNFEYEFITKIIFNLDDRQYFTLIHNFSNFYFNPTFNTDFQNVKLLPFPIYSIIFHSIFYKIFNIYGFIIIEFFLILTFFYILINFFKKMDLSLNESLLLTLFFFCLPSLIDFFHLFNFPYAASLKELYNMRVPRPVVTHLYLFLFFYLLINKNKNELFKAKELAFIGIIFALMWGSYYYNLVTTGITFLFYYFLRGNGFNITRYLKDASIVLFFFVIFSVPIIYIILNAEPDYLTRVGLIDLGFEKKKILLVHFLNQIFSFKFLVIFFSILLFYFFLRIKSLKSIETINLLLFIFFGSFIGPIIFIIISPTISEIYHFSNMLGALSFFVFTIFLYLIFSIYLKKNFKLFNSLIKVLTFILIVIFFAHNKSLYEDKASDPHLKNNNELINVIKKINLNENNTILTLDGDVQTNLIFNGYKNLKFIIGINTSLKDEHIENQLINIFKFFNLNQNDFLEFFENKKNGWRFLNTNVGKTFYMKYQANKLVTFNNSLDFSKDELEAISKSSPLHSQQLIIPYFEIERMINKFNSSNTSKEFQPDLIIVNLNDEISKKIIIENNNYCSKIINKSYKIYIRENINLSCDL